MKLFMRQVQADWRTMAKFCLFTLMFYILKRILTMCSYTPDIIYSTFKICVQMFVLNKQSLPSIQSSYANIWQSWIRHSFKTTERLQQFWFLIQNWPINVPKKNFFYQNMTDLSICWLHKPYLARCFHYSIWTFGTLRKLHLKRCGQICPNFKLEWSQDGKAFLFVYSALFYFAL